MKIFNGRESGGLGVATHTEMGTRQVSRRSWLKGAGGATLGLVGFELATSGCGPVFQDAMNQENVRNGEVKQFVDSVIVDFGVQIAPSSIVVEMKNVCTAEVRKNLLFGTVHSIMIHPDLYNMLSHPSRQYVVLHELGHIVEPEGDKESVANGYAYRQIETKYGSDYAKRISAETEPAIDLFWRNCKK